MIDVIIGYLDSIYSLIEGYIPTMLNLLVGLLWILFVRKLHLNYKISLIVTLVLLAISAIPLILHLSQTAGIFGEYAFLFLLIGVIHYLISDNDSK